MFRKFVVLMVVVLVAGIVGLGSASAALAASGPDNPAALPGDWVKLDAGARVWYAFQYGGDGSAINVRVSASPANAVSFSVWTPGDVAYWAATGKEQPVGRGSASNLFGGDLVWTGGFNQAGTYFVVVQNGSSNPAYYLPTVSGSAVYVATAKAQPAAAPAATSAAVSEAVAAPAAKPAKSGAGPADARALPGDWVKLDAGARVWYAFQYGGDGSAINVRVSASPANAVSFSVWTPGDVTSWAATGKEDPVGRGSVNSRFGGDLFWTGSFNQAGTYFVVVQNDSSAPAYYLLTASGSAVSSSAS
jgi:hypothetical protein